MLTVKVTGFGPIHDGVIQLKPLTVFIGTNNSGKSYLAMLLYAIHHAGILPFSRTLTSRSRAARRFFFHTPFLGLDDFSVDEETLSVWREWLLQEPLDRRESRDVDLTDLPTLVRDLIHNTLHNAVNSYGELFGKELSRCFGAELPDLLAPAKSKQALHITISSSSPSWTIDVHCTKKRIEAKLTDFSLDRIAINSRDLPPIRLLRDTLRESTEISERNRDILEDSLFEAISSAHVQFFRPIFGGCHYLPAARSGILQSHKTLAHLLISQSSRIGIERFNLPQLPGVITDFLANIIGLEQRRTTSLSKLSKLLESDVMGGDIEVGSARVEYPEIYYRSSNGRFPLGRTSSMISELAPVSLYMKYIVEKGNVFIIEEPESHLHPENQRKLARIIVRLVREGVNLIITTHSDYLLSQINNFLRLGVLDSSERKNKGYSEDDYLKQGEVAPYLFENPRLPNQRPVGTSVKEIEVSLEDGISESEFARVSEALYEETVRLERATYDHQEQESTASE